MYEDDLIPLLEECGQLYDLRIMMDSIAGGNRGYGFAMFVDKDAAKHAVEKVIVARLLVYAVDSLYSRTTTTVTFDHCYSGLPSVKINLLTAMVCSRSVDCDCVLRNVNKHDNQIIRCLQTPVTRSFYIVVSCSWMALKFGLGRN